jgi:hypothetical protein
VTKIKEWAFFRCRNLFDITLPDSITEIGQYSFAESGCLEQLKNKRCSR